MISVELDNGCHAMLDEGKTEKVRDDFSADETNMDPDGIDWSRKECSKQLFDS